LLFAVLKMFGPAQVLRGEEIMADKHDKRKSRKPDIVAGNGLIYRRSLLGRGIVYAGAVSAGVGTSLNGAAAEPLAVEPWSMAPGITIPPYGVPSRLNRAHADQSEA
jgi:hypothetical protein